MATAEFDLPSEHLGLPVAPPTGFPDASETQEAVLAQVEARLRENKYPPEHNFAITYSGTPRPISQRIEALTQAVRLHAARCHDDDDRRSQARASADRDWLLPVARGRPVRDDPDRADAIHTTSSTKPGSRAASAWATFRHLGRAGYDASTAHVLGLRDRIVQGVTAIPGIALLAPPLITVLAFRSDVVDLRDVHKRMAGEGWGQGYGEIRGRPFIRLSIHPSRTLEAADGFVAAFERATIQARRR